MGKGKKGLGRDGEIEERERLKKRRKRDIPGDEAEMIEQSPLEVGFILPVFSPKTVCVFFFFSFGRRK